MSVYDQAKSIEEVGGRGRCKLHPVGIGGDGHVPSQRLTIAGPAIGGAKVAARCLVPAIDGAGLI